MTTFTHNQVFNILIIHSVKINISDSTALKNSFINKNIKINEELSFSKCVVKNNAMHKKQINSIIK